MWQWLSSNVKKKVLIRDLCWRIYELNKSAVALKYSRKSSSGNEWEGLAITYLLLKLGNGYMEFTTPFSIFWADFEIFPQRKAKSKTLPHFNLWNLLLFNLHFTRLGSWPQYGLIPIPPNSTGHLLHEATAWGQCLWGDLRENVFALCCPSYPFSIRIGLSPIFWNTRYLYFITHYSLSHLPVGWAPSVPDPESLICHIPSEIEHNECLFNWTSPFCCSNRPAAGCPLQGKKSFPQAKSFIDKGEKAIQFHRHFPRPTAGVLFRHTATSHTGQLNCMLVRWVRPSS